MGDHEPGVLSHVVDTCLVEIISPVDVGVSAAGLVGFVDVDEGEAGETVPD